MSVLTYTHSYYYCKQLWERPQINWDGRLFGCCCNQKIDFGCNVFDIGLEKALSSPLYAQAKDLLLNRNNQTMAPIQCQKCSYYKRMCENNEFIKETDFS